MVSGNYVGIQISYSFVMKMGGQLKRCHIPHYCNHQESHTMQSSPPSHRMCPCGQSCNL